jgi:hypothetical protein
VARIALEIPVPVRRCAALGDARAIAMKVDHHRAVVIEAVARKVDRAVPPQEPLHAPI